MSASSDDRFFVYFLAGSATLEDAREALPLHDLGPVGVSTESFTVNAEGLRFRVSLEESAEVATAAQQAAGDQQRWQTLANCAARFSVEVSDLPAALDEINTMMELQGALQDCSDGYLVLPWNGGILGPWGAAE
ncbi:hypothetical protein [Psychromicrobium lacuslunae]|uniref:Uncharacterized protein n=1 Tax=Psychromicrobium lacuslunae TaxID=1618207 RepID=A0A0D4BX97_9MICC|nr:hypothetical protein [Psychromicrobium lacuslunae]AJT40949.1 hypothetical protein UM93_04455 [Psychromicrobium lacuslunae]